MKRLLVCTDLDRTLLPNGVQPESPMARQLFGRLTAHPEICLVYVTGRHKVLVQQAIKCYALPDPDLVISDVGSCIYDVRGGQWLHWQAWEAEISPDWGGLTHTELRERFRDIRALRLQEREKQNTYKLSYYVPLDEDEQVLIAEMQRRLEKGAIQASLIWSIDEPAAVGLLDVLPMSATKLHAIQFLREQLGFGLDQTLFAGDSGNDLPVLTSSIRSVLVANAATSVRIQARADAERQGCLDALYVSKGGFRGMNGNYAAGILEGIVHYEPEIDTWIEEVLEADNAV